jgi:hypothetical protein
MTRMMFAAAIAVLAVAAVPGVSPAAPGAPIQAGVAATSNLTPVYYHRHCAWRHHYRHCW